ncbi:ATP-binding SpoIIE family protein phosphatase [Anatilimnocola floriformis]|uniref:ATP-binding SpoIIE family protein phosphatase n=1 Tax=Anatilimnocola floriformis TaxID=2948575 RepID=UPI0020C26F89|nr:ATP-binding SpoIIE family protein phosphatase [Anatilimnocola floriformis]
MYCHAVFPVIEITQVGEARRQAARLAEAAGLNESLIGKISVVVSELATNLVRYAKKGEILLRPLNDAAGPGLEVIAVDHGPGIVNTGRSLEDGYSTGGTAGNGLGAVKRLSTEFDIFGSLASATQPGGTVVFSRMRAIPAHKRSMFEWGTIERPAPHEIECGDTWRIVERGHELSILMVDGLGHGPQAAESAAVAAEVFSVNPFAAPTELLPIADRRLRGMRGATIAITQINACDNKLTYAGVGNIAGHLRSRTGEWRKGLMSHNGTVGAEMRKVQQIEYDYPEQPLLILHSDGLQTRWLLENYPGLINCHPAVIAAVLARDFTRGRDDLTVCVVRSTSPFAI